MSASLSPNARRRTLHIAAAFGLAGLVAPVFTGCGSPPVITPEGAWSVSFIDSGPDCTIAGHNTIIGNVTKDKVGDTIADGETLDGTESSPEVDVYCTVEELDGGDFYVDAGASISGTVLGIIVNELSPDATKDNPSKGSVNYLSPNTADFMNSAECNFYFSDGTPQTVEAGKVFLTFECPALGGDAGTCTITPGYADFEKCSTARD